MAKETKSKEGVVDFSAVISELRSIETTLAEAKAEIETHFSCNERALAKVCEAKGGVSAIASVLRSMSDLANQASKALNGNTSPQGPSVGLAIGRKALARGVKVGTSMDRRQPRTSQKARTAVSKRRVGKAK